tara:strand:+ start:1675 stop:3441 length:1767 start_codon:yes stop_codon:yes gene_type:complete
MIINLNFDKRKVIELIHHYPNEKILDITGVLQNQNLNQKVIFARQIDEDHFIEKQSIENYVQTIGELGTLSHRKININSLPLWWLTKLSEKHDRFHWGQSVFFLLELFKLKKEIFFKEIKFILPDKNPGISKFLNENLNENSQFKFSFINPKPDTINQYFLYRSMIKPILLYLKFKALLFFKPLSKKQKNKHFFIVNNYETANTNSDNFDINWVKKLVNSATKNSTNIPIPNFYKLGQLDLSRENINHFCNYSPKVSSILFTFYKVIRLSKKLNQSIEPIKSNGIIFNTELLISEFKSVLHNSNLFLAHLWMKNYSKKNPEKIFIYSDEMYQIGRVLSHALNTNLSNKTVGVQHGLITPNHTVYRITEHEINEQNSIPLPSKIILWNSVFSNYMTKTCSKIKTHFIFSNDYHYIEMVKNVHLLQKKKSGHKFNVLWATTLWEHFISEYEVIKPLFDFNSIHLTIRLHPANHIAQNQINEKLKAKDFIFSTSSYEIDLSETDLVISNTFSTVFYDASKLNLPTFRIEHYGSFCDFETTNNQVVDINNSLQFKKQLEDIISKISSVSNKNTRKITSNTNTLLETKNYLEI